MPKSMKSKTKILYFVDILEYGGIQNFILNVLKNIKDTDIEILTLDDGNNYPLEKEIEELGIKVYKLNNIWIKDLFSYLKYKKAINNFFKEHNDYKMIHLHSTSKNYYILEVAKKYNIDIRIVHSHTTDFSTSNKLKKILGTIWKKKLLKYATDYFACSKEAGEWMFEKNRFLIIPNGIDSDKFIFNDKYRKEIRKEYNLENKFIIGNVARITHQKNPLLLIDILNELKEKNKDVFLIIIGSGELENKLQRKIEKYNLEKDILILKNRNDVYKFYSAFDCFILTSPKEAFCIAAIEAQINGLKCITLEDVLPPEVKISHNVEEVNNIDNFTKEILNSTRNNDNIDIKRFDIKEVVKYLEKYYQSR